MFWPTGGIYSYLYIYIYISFIYSKETSSEQQPPPQCSTDGQFECSMAQNTDIACQDSEATFKGDEFNIKKFTESIRQSKPILHKHALVQIPTGEFVPNQIPTGEFVPNQIPTGECTKSNSNR